MENKGKPCDPGWNDPPMFSYEAQNAQLKSSKPRTLLNKRVAFPLQASSQTPGTNIVDPTASLPPCSLGSFPPPPLKPLMHAEDTVDKSSTNECMGHFDMDVALDLVMNRLSNKIELLENKEKDKEDILRRLNLMKEMWINKKLNRDIQEKLLKLSKALENNDIAMADELQKGLMVDHAQLCSPWMSGVRQILRLFQSEPLPTSTTVEDVKKQLPTPASVETIFTPTPTVAADETDGC